MTLLCMGILIAFLGSLRAWFLWPLGNLYILPAVFFVVGAMLLARTMDRDTIFTRNDFIITLSTLIVYIIYERLSINSNIKGYIAQTCLIIIFLSLFKLKYEKLQHVADFISRVMGGLLAASIVGHLLYLIGVPLPNQDVQYDEFYSFSNYYLFLLDDRNLFYIFPRFNSYFLEPSHIGQACAFLLMTQRGKWRQWYNVVMIATIGLSFSLASYIYLVVILIFNQWISRKHIASKLLLVCAFLTLGVIATFNYNKGNNLVHDLIMLRLELDDGEMEGDNRVTDNFLAQYENFLESNDVFLGRSFEIEEFGNAGYRVFFYEHGIVGIILIFLFYVTSMINAPNKRAFVAVIIVTALYFWATSFMLFTCVYFPLYAAAHSDISNDL